MAPDTSTELRTIDFHGDRLQAVRRSDGVWVVLRPMCDGIGLDFNGQYQRLSDPDRCPWAVMCKMHMTGADGKSYEMTVLHLDSLPMWLATISSGSVKDPLVKAKLIAYQRECARVLRDYFFVGEAVNPRQVESPESVVKLLSCCRDILSLGTGLEPRDALLLKDYARSHLAVSTGQPLALTRHVTLPERCVELGYPRPGRGEDGQVGKAVVAAYRRRHGGDSPPQHDQFVDGRTVKVYGYTDQDIESVDEGIHEYHRRHRPHIHSELPGS